MKILITGFEPFGGEKVNPSFEAVKKLQNKICDADIVKAQIPTVFHRSIEELEKLINAEQPDVVICVGQAGGRFDISIERVAINIDDARIADNDGNKPVDEPVFKDGENAYFASLPIKAIVEEIKKANIPASISNTAGTYVCNHIMYGLLYLIDKKYPKIRGGFIHVPFITEQIIDKSNVPYMEISKITEGLTLAIKGVVENKEDLKIPYGKIC